MNNRHNVMKKGCLLALGMLLLAGSEALTRSAQAQDLAEYLEAMILEELGSYGITGGELVLGVDPDAWKTDRNVGGSLGFYNIAAPEVLPAGSATDHAFEYLRMEVAAAGNPWDAGINWFGETDVVPGQTGLAMILIRGATTENEPGRVTFIFERNTDPWDKSLDRQYDVSSDWRLFIEPFTFATNLPGGQNQFAFHLAHRTQWIEMTAPIVINYGNDYSEEELQAIIEQGGGVPTVARFEADVVTGPAPLEVTFDASASSSAGTITSYAWTFGDGTNGSGAVVTHTYQEPQSYTVTLTVTDNSGQSAVTTRTITVTPLEGSLLQPLEIHYTATAPTIDGERDEVWDIASTVNIASHVNNQPPTSEEDISGTASVLWDEDHLYVFYEIRDDVLQRVEDNNTWQNDAVDLYVDTQNNKSDSYDLTYQSQMEFGWDATAVTGKGPSDLQGVTFEFQTTDVGYNIEAAVPWSIFGFTPENGAVIGIEFMVNDNDTGASGDQGRKTKLAWFGLEDNAWQWPRLFGNALLLGQPVSTEGGLELPEAFAIESVYPNPFNPTATVAVQVRDLGEYRVRVYNVLGQLVAQHEVMATAVGRMEVSLAFDAMASGVYAVAVEHPASGKILTATAILMK